MRRCACLYDEAGNDRIALMGCATKGINPMHVLGRPGWLSRVVVGRVPDLKEYSAARSGPLTRLPGASGESAGYLSNENRPLPVLGFHYFC